MFEDCVHTNVVDPFVDMMVPDPCISGIVCVSLQVQDPPVNRCTVFHIRVGI